MFPHADLVKLFKASQSTYEKDFVKYIHTRAEKYAIIEYMRKAGVNDYTKIRFAEQHTGYKFQ